MQTVKIELYDKGDRVRTWRGDGTVVEDEVLDARFTGTRRAYVQLDEDDDGESSDPQSLDPWAFIRLPPERQVSPRRRSSRRRRT